jgi:hypothetical protein
MSGCRALSMCMARIIHLLSCPAFLFPLPCLSFISMPKNLTLYHRGTSVCLRRFQNFDFIFFANKIFLWHFCCFHIRRTRFYDRNTSSKVQLPEVAVPDKVSSLSLLQQALMLHPSVLKKIVDKAPIKEDAVWSKILKKPHFSKATSGGPSLEHLINIYVERNYLVWRAPEVQTWLKTAASTVADAAEKSVATKNGGEVANWACVRKEAFPSDQNE